MQDSERDNRALTADIIRAVDSLANRCDTLTARIEAVERSLGDIVDTLGADLVQLRAMVASLPSPVESKTTTDEGSGE